MAQESPESVRFDEYIERLPPTIQIEIQSATAFGDGNKISAYPMNTRVRGILLFINIVRFVDDEDIRYGANHDRKNLIHLFRELGFQTFYYENLTSQLFKDVIKKFSKQKFLKNCDSFFFIITSHGTSYRDQQKICFSDDEYLDVEKKIIRKFNHKHCPNLFGKPKVLIILPCRGNEEDFGPSSQDTEEWISLEPDYGPDTSPKPKRKKSIPSESDMLIIYGNLANRVVHRTLEQGNLFVEEFCRIVSQNAHDTEFYRMLQLLSAALENKINDLSYQIPEIYNRGFKNLLYFNPGIFLDENMEIQKIV